MPTLERNGYRVYYEVTGQGPVLLLGHSLFLDGRMWDRVAPDLARDFRVINVDARCHRRSTSAGPFVLEDLADDWRAILDQENVERAYLAGLSMGGMTAMRLALRAPDRVAAMALLDTNGAPEAIPDRHVYMLIAEIQKRVRMDFLSAPILERKMFGRTTQRTNRALVDRGMAMIQEKEPRALYPAMRAVFTRKSIVDQLAGIRCPTLVLCGEEDTATAPAHSRTLAERIPGAILRMISGAGHLSAMEQPSIVTGHLQGFFGEHASRAA